MGYDHALNTLLECFEPTGLIFVGTMRSGLQRLWPVELPDHFMWANSAHEAMDDPGDRREDKFCVNVQNVFLSKDNGEEMYFHSSLPVHSGSIDPAFLSQFWRNIHEVEQELRKTVCLDQFLEHFPKQKKTVESVNWLIVDQLAALNVLEGAKSFLEQVDAVVIKVLSDESFADAPAELSESSSYSSICKWLCQRGFKPIARKEGTHPAFYHLIFAHDWKSELTSTLENERANFEDQILRLEQSNKQKLADLKEQHASVLENFRKEVEAVSQEKLQAQSQLEKLKQDSAEKMSSLQTDHANKMVATRKELENTRAQKGAVEDLLQKEKLRSNEAQEKADALIGELKSQLEKLSQESLEQIEKLREESRSQLEISKSEQEKADTLVSELNSQLEKLNQETREQLEKLQEESRSKLESAKVDAQAQIEALNEKHLLEIANVQDALDKKDAELSSKILELNSLQEEVDWVRETAGISVPKAKPSECYEIDENYISRKTYTHFDDTDNEDDWQLEVYLAALGLMKKHGLKSVADFGCGSGYKLVQYFGEYDIVGYDLESTVENLRKTYEDVRWEISDLTSVNGISADVIICSDVIEHLVDPDELIDYFKRSHFRYLVFSTPDRDLIYPNKAEGWYGPPRNPAHVREWTFEEFGTYVGNHFEIDRHQISNAEQYTQLLVCKPPKITMSDKNMKFEESLKHSEMRYLLCVPLGGLNDTFCQIEKCLNYAERNNRILIIDSRKSGLHGNFGDFFEIKKSAAPVVTIVEDADYEKLNNLSRLPKTKSESINMMKVNFDSEAKNWVETSGKTQLTFDFDQDHDEVLLVHYQCGGGNNSQELLKRIQLKSDISDKIHAKFSSFPPEYDAIHIRNTDYQTDYRAYFEEIKNKIRSSYLLVTSDDPDVYQHAVSTWADKTVFRAVEIPDTDGKPLHGQLTFKSPEDGRMVTELTLIDLFALGGAESIYSSKIHNRFLSGFTRLAIFLSQNKDVLRSLIQVKNSSH